MLQEKMPTYKSKQIGITSDVSVEIPKARKAWNDAFQTLKDNNCQPSLLYLANLSFKIDG
jgi:hypothetical protein